jgi:hypothetical protein
MGNNNTNPSKRSMPKGEMEKININSKNKETNQFVNDP